jgi:hypothetical protein
VNQKPRKTAGAGIVEPEFAPCTSIMAAAAVIGADLASVTYCRIEDATSRRAASRPRSPSIAASASRILRYIGLVKNALLLGRTFVHGPITDRGVDPCSQMRFFARTETLARIDSFASPPH